MVDIVDPSTRSRMMSAIRGRNTKPEILVRSMLHKDGFRFRLHAKDLPGKPDIVLPRYQAVIFVHGCFWHGHKCPLFKLPATRVEFWENKINQNLINDTKVKKLLLAAGWRVGIVWECAIRGAGVDLVSVTKLLAKWLYGENKEFEVSK